MVFSIPKDIENSFTNVKSENNKGYLTQSFYELCKNTNYKFASDICRKNF